MATASVVLDGARIKFGDTQKNFISDSVGLTWLDEAQKQLTERLLPLKRQKGFTVAANDDAFSVPDDCLMIEVAVNIRGWRRVLRRVTPEEFRHQQTLVQNAVGDPVIWTEMDGRVYVWPRYSSASLTSTVNASTTATTSTITLASTGNLRSYGTVKIDSEEIEYTGKTTTTLTGARRGAGGTTAATHVSAATVTQLDFELIYARHATSLSAQTDELEVKESWHVPLLQNYVLSQAFMAEGSQDKAEFYAQLWEGGLEEAKKIARRRHIAGMLQVRDVL